jgi:nitrite reductase/ring-hydroxylating ferredoxin subunit
MDDIPVAPLSNAPYSQTQAAARSAAGRPGHAPIPENSRRGFFYNLFTAMVAGLVAVVPVAAGLAVYLDPIRRKSRLGNFLPVTTIDKLPDASKGDALIGRFPILADRIDAWNIYPNEPIGSVYLVVPKGSNEIVALQGKCPHLGCTVDVRDEGEGKFSFKCPCHTSAFTSDGKMVLPCVSPRDMDVLECQVNPAADGGQEVLVKFQEFLPGIAEKKAKT